MIYKSFTYSGSESKLPRYISVTFCYQVFYGFAVSLDARGL
jgi:hypothetical protein